LEYGDTLLDLLQVMSRDGVGIVAGTLRVCRERQQVTDLVDLEAEVPAVAESTTMPMWPDGDAVEVDLQAGELLDVDDALLGHDDSFAEGLLPVEDLAWVDELADDEIDAAEAMLESTDRKKG